MKGSITKKILSAILLTNAIAITIILATIVFLINATIGEDVRENSKLIVDQATAPIETEIQTIETIVNVLRVDFEQSFDEQAYQSSPNYMEEFLQEQKEQMMETAQIAENSNSIYYYPNVDKYGEGQDMWLLDAEFSGEFEKQAELTEYFFDEDGKRIYHQWYDLPIEENKAIWSDPYLSANGDLITSRVTPVWQEGEIIGVLGMDLDLTQNAALINETTLFNTGYIFLAKQDGTIIIHKDFEPGDNITNYGNYTQLLESWQSQEASFDEYINNDGMNMVSAHKRLSNGWVMVAAIPESELLEVINYVIFLILGIAIIIFILSITLAIFVSKSISKPIKEISNTASKIKEGDFTQQIQVKSNDETKLLAGSINAMTTNIRSLISDIRSVSIDMSDSASVLASTAQETTAMVEQVSGNVDEITHGTASTAEEAQNGALIANNIDQKFNKLMKNSHEMKASASSASIANKKGLDMLNILKDKTKTTKQSNSKVEQVIHNLNDQTKAITSVIEVITSIAEQTNLLALNASIEAARAGEAGKGFAVVATEIRNLAEESTKAADEINNIINSINHESKDAVMVMNDLKQISQEQNQAVEDTGGAFETIYRSMTSITAQIESIVEALKGLDYDKNELVSVVNNISAAAEQAAAATEDVNQSTDEQAKAVEEVALSAEKLNELSLLLKKHIDIFKI